MVELVRECVRVEGAEGVIRIFGPPAVGRKLPSPHVIWASNKLNSPKMTSSSDSCVSSRLAIDMRYVCDFVDSADDVAGPRSLNFRNLTGPAFPAVVV
uniref:Uncharacterized protein n=1 Tax=Glossina palpalis gambiensis TaxID=67801 RepID=A0A1B0BWB4_9MUSC